jgi:hypothetical protein
LAGTVRELNVLELAERCTLVAQVLSLLVFVAEALPIWVPWIKYVNVYDDAVASEAGKQKSFVIPDAVPNVMDCENAYVRYSSAAVAPLGKLLPNTVGAKLVFPTEAVSVPVVVDVVPGSDRLASVNPDPLGGVGITAGLAGTEPRLLKAVWKVKLDASVACGVGVAEDGVGVADLGHDSNSTLTTADGDAALSEAICQVLGFEKATAVPAMVVGGTGPATRTTPDWVCTKISNWTAVKSRLAGKPVIIIFDVARRAADPFGPRDVVIVYPSATEPVAQLDCAVRRWACDAGNWDAVAAATVTLTGPDALTVIEPVAPSDVAGRLSVKVPLCAPDDAVAPGVDTELDEVQAETMPLSATKARKRYIRLRITAALLVSKKKGIATK